MRDFQRSKVYSAERVLRDAADVLPLEELRALATEIVTSKYWEDRFPGVAEIEIPCSVLVSMSRRAEHVAVL